MTDASEFEPVIDLANEYLERLRAGEQPTVEEYAARYPDLANRIRDVFPMMRLMEDNAPDTTVSDDSEQTTQQLERLGDFRILREIGRGGMGVVYEAVQESLGRHVALKVFPRHAHLNPQHQERFKRESRSAAMLHHTNIVPVFAVGDDQGMLYYAMQYIRGAGLDEVIIELNRLGPVGQKTIARTRAIPQSVVASQVALSMMTDSESAEPTKDVFSQQPRSLSDSSSVSGVHLPGQSNDASLSETGREYWQSVARIGVQVAEALKYAHSQGTLHRDIKPSNLLLDQYATVWVTDFGLAKSLQEEDLTHTGELVGTLRYMPPEQFAGNSDERSDLYSLGLTLYELVTLRPAFDMPDRHQLVKAISDSVPPRPRKLNSRIPRDLETIILKAIEREPNRRYQTADALSLDLTRFLNNEPLRAKPVGSIERIIKWARRRPAIATLTAALFTLFLVSFALVTWKWLEAEAAKAQVKIERDDAIKSEKAERAAKLNEARERKRKEELLDESEQNLYYSLLAQADFQRQQNDINAARRTLDSAPENRRGWEWHYLSRQLHLDLMTLAAGTEDAPWIRCLAFSPDGRLLATGSSLPDFLNANEGAAGAARIWDLATGKKVLDLGDRVKSVTAIALSFDSKLLATYDIDLPAITGMLRIWDVASGDELVRMHDEHDISKLPYCVDLQFSPDGSLLTGKSGRSSSSTMLRVWETLSGRQLWSRRITSASVKFSADGSRIRTRLVPDDPQGNWAEFDAQSGDIAKKMQQPVGYEVGNRVILRTGTFAKVFGKSSGELQYTLRDPYGPLGCLVARPDGRQLATSSLDGSIRLWDLATGELQHVLRGHSTQLLGVSYSADGQYLASGDWDGIVKVWHLDSTGSFVNNLTGRIEDIAFRFGSRALVTARYPNTVQTWDALSGKELCQIQMDMQITRGLGPARQVAFDGSGNRIAGGSKSDKSVFNVWNVETGQKQLSLSGFEDLTNYVAFSDNGDMVAAAAGNFPGGSPHSTGRIRVWDVRMDQASQSNRPAEQTDNDRMLLEIAEPGQRTTALAFSPDGSRLAIAGHILTSGEDDSARKSIFGIWKVDNSSPTRQRVHHWSSNARAGASSSYVPISMGTRSDSETRTDINCLAFSPNGQTLAAAEYRTGYVRLYDAIEGTEIIHFNGPTGVQDLAFSPDGKRLAGVTRDSTTIWDVKNGREVIRLRGKRKQRDLIFNPSVQFSPDGRHVASTQWHKDYSFLIRTADLSANAESREEPSSKTSNGASAFWAQRLENLNAIVEAEPENGWYRLARSKEFGSAGDQAMAQQDYVAASRLISTGKQNGTWLEQNQFIEAPHIPFDQYESFTVEAWVKDWNNILIFQADALQPGLILDHRSSSYTIRRKGEMGYKYANSAEYRAHCHRVKFHELRHAGWKHLAVVLEKDRLFSFVDGRLISEVENVPRSAPLKREQIMWIGGVPADHYRRAYSGSGVLGSLRISNVARYVDDFKPADRITSDEQTILMYDFAQQLDSPSIRIQDLSDNGNDGRLQNAWWLK